MKEIEKIFGKIEGVHLDGVHLEFTVKSESVTLKQLEKLSVLLDTRAINLRGLYYDVGTEVTPDWGTHMVIVCDDITWLEDM
jgi:hypothetical protein